MTVLLFLLPPLVAAAISFALTPMARRLSFRLGAVDRPSERKVHTEPVARLGGLAVVAASGIVLAGLCKLSVPRLQSLPGDLCAGLALGVLPIFAISFWDDIKALAALPKLAAQFAGAGVAVAFGIRLGEQVHLFGHEIAIGFFAIPISLLWIVGVTNAFNIVDGLDGLSAGLALISAASLAAIALVAARFNLACTALVLAGALVGFLPYNLYPAKVFLGDTGAACVGFGLACLALRGGSTLSSGMAILVPVVVLGLPVAETLVSMARRALRRLSRLPGGGVFEADREHMHHRLLAMGLGHRQAVLILYGVGVTGASLGVLSLFLSYRGAAVLLAALLTAAFIGIARVGYNEFALLRRGVVLKIYEVPVLKRGLFPVFFDLGLVTLAIYAAIVLKYDDWSVRSHRDMALDLMAFLPASALAVFWAFRMYRHSWRLAGVGDLVRVVVAVAAAGAAGYSVVWIVLGDRVSLTYFLTCAMVLLVLVVGSRSSFRILTYLKERARTTGDTVLIYGAGRSGKLALREILGNESRGARLAGFIDDDPQMRGKDFNGYRILGAIADLPHILAERKVAEVVIACSDIAPDNVARALEACRRAGIRASRLHVDFEALSLGSEE